MYSHAEKILRLVEQAKKKIVKLQSLLEKANERRRKHDEARAKLKPGKKIPEYLLPSEKDLRSRAMNQVKERKTLENDTMPEAALRGGWFYSAATVHRNGLRITATKQRVLSDTQLASVLKLLGIKKDKKWTSETIEIDSFGSVSVSYNQSYQRPDLNVKSVVENAMAGIRTFADSFAAGKIKKGYSKIAVVDFHARQDAIKPPIAREIDNVIDININEASKRRFEKVSEVGVLEQEVKENIKNDQIYKANTS